MRLIVDFPTIYINSNLIKAVFHKLLLAPFLNSLTHNIPIADKFECSSRFYDGFALVSSIGLIMNGKVLKVTRDFSIFISDQYY